MRRIQESARSRPSHRSWVYILASRKNGTLYVGVTTNLRARVLQHKLGALGGFTKQHGVTALVYFEEFGNLKYSIAREKELKGWSRSRKILLIETSNADWDHLAAGWIG